MRKRFRNMKISKKLIVAFSVIIAITLIVGVIGFINLFNIKNADAELYKQYTQGLQYSGDAAVTFQQLRYNMLKIDKLMSSDGAQSEIDALVTSSKDALTGISNTLAKCDTILVADEFREMLTDITDNWSDYTVLMNQNLDFVSKNDWESFAGNAKAAGELGVTVREKFLELFAGLSTRASESSAANANTANLGFIIMAAAIAVAIIISVLLGRILSSDISYPVTKLSMIADKVSEGNIQIEKLLDKRDLDINLRKDEIGGLALSFNKLIAYINEHVGTIQLMADGDLTAKVSIRSEDDVLGKGLTHLIDSLNELVTTIASASEQVESGANLVSGSSVSLSQGATEQASAVQELTASLTEIASQTNLNAGNAEKASNLVSSSRINAENGNKLMKEMQIAMNEITESSNRINKIIKVIDDIAFQTNILALNAAVEAARAGQHGKGFAVVAEEVRTLAAKSASAASETTDMIENSIRKVEAGTSLANSTAEALSTIVSEVRDAASLVNSIAEASKEQAKGIEQIGRGISQVSQVTQTNVATSEESAAASEELASQSSYLRETISVFRVNGSLKTRAGFDQNNSGGSRQPSRASRALAAGPRAGISLGDESFGKY